jgi:hypothetical protein
VVKGECYKYQIYGTEAGLSTCLVRVELHYCKCICCNGGGGGIFVCDLLIGRVERCQLIAVMYIFTSVLDISSIVSNMPLIHSI